VTADKFINRLIAITICAIGLGLTVAYVVDPSVGLKEPLLLVLGSLLTALRLGHTDEPVQVTDVTPYPNTGTNPGDL
jgi:hypothetical protein